MSELIKPHGGDLPEGLTISEPFHPRAEWINAFIWGNAHFPQTYVGITPLVELAVFSDLCGGRVSVEDFERSVLSPDQINQVTRVALAHDNIPGSATSHAHNSRFNSESIQDLWVDARDMISVKMTRLTKMVQGIAQEDGMKVDKGQFFKNPQYTAERNVVMDFLQRVSASLRSEDGLALSRGIKTATVQFYQRPPLLRKFSIKTTRNFKGNREQLVSLIRGQIDQTRLPELQELLLVVLKPEH